MALTREQFAENLKRGTEAVRENIAQLCSNKLPDQDRYFVILNSSFDGNPLATGEVLFPDHDIPQSDVRTPRTADEVVEKLWRNGRVPEWIDITPYETDGNFLYSELRCCGRFASEDSLLYHKPEGYPPFHVFGPLLPPGYRDLEKDGKFDLHWYRDGKQKNKIKQALHRGQICVVTAFTMLGVCLLIDSITWMSGHVRYRIIFERVFATPQALATDMQWIQGAVATLLSGIGISLWLERGKRR